MTTPTDNPQAIMEPTCGECVHCQPGPKTQEDILSRACYRNPPSVFGVLTQQGVAIMSIRPEIRTDTIACGEFETEEDGAMPVGLTS